MEEGMQQTSLQVKLKTIVCVFLHTTLRSDTYLLLRLTQLTCYSSFGSIASLIL